MNLIKFERGQSIQRWWVIGWAWFFVSSWFSTASRSASTISLSTTGTIQATLQDKFVTKLQL
jgi:hypothetical protein